MFAARIAILFVAAIVATAQADVVNFLNYSRSVEAVLEFSPAGGPPVTFETNAATSELGMFDETAAVADAGYASQASQTSDIHAAGVWANGEVSLTKPLTGSDVPAYQTALSALTVEFNLLSETPYSLDADFAFNIDTGGTSIAFGSLNAVLSGPGGSVFEQSYSFPSPDSFASAGFLSDGTLTPGTYTLAISTQLALNSMAYDIGGDATASYSLDFSLVPEPSAAFLLASLTVLAGTRRR